MSTTDSISTSRLSLTPLEVADAAEMVGVLSDPTLYSFIGGAPPTLAELEELYRRQCAGDPDGRETWRNWILRLDGAAIGYVQATVNGDSAELAWVVGVPWQGSGYATEASLAVRDWLAAAGVVKFSAHIHPDHRTSHAIATTLGLQPTSQVDDDGEVVWG